MARKTASHLFVHKISFNDLFTHVYALFVYAHQQQSVMGVRFRFYSETSRSQYGFTPRQLQQHFKQNKCPHKFAKEFRSHFKHFLFEYLSICLFSHFDLSCSNTVFLISRYKSNFFTNLGKREKSLRLLRRRREEEERNTFLIVGH